MCERKYQHTQHSLLTVTHPHACIHIHCQYSHSHSGITFTLSSDASRRLRSTRPVFGFMREQRSDRSNEGGTQSTLSHQRSSTVINGHIHTHIHTQFGRQPATSFNSTGIWIYERTALRPVERRGHSVDTQSSAAISGHQRSLATTIAVAPSKHLKASSAI